MGKKCHSDLNQDVPERLSRLNHIDIWNSRYVDITLRERSARGGSQTSFRVLAGRTRRCYARRRRVRAQDDERAGGERAWILSWTRNAVRRAERSGAEQSRAGQAREQCPFGVIPFLAIARILATRGMHAVTRLRARVLSLFLSLPLSLSFSMLARFLWKSCKSGSSTRDFSKRVSRRFDYLSTPRWQSRTYKKRVDFYKPELGWRKITTIYVIYLFELYLFEDKEIYINAID